MVGRLIWTAVLGLTVSAQVAAPAARIETGASVWRADAAPEILLRPLPDAAPSSPRFAMAALHGPARLGAAPRAVRDTVATMAVGGVGRASVATTSATTAMAPSRNMPGAWLDIVPVSAFPWDTAHPAPRGLERPVNVSTGGLAAATQVEPLPTPPIPGTPRMEPASSGAVFGNAAAGAAERPTDAGRILPRRVVSMNLCTDQLAMMLAAPGQLVSVSYLASDPRASAMTMEAARYPRNYGLAEEIVLLKPDLVLAGRYSAGATTALLKRIGVPVQVFDPETGLADIRNNVRRMGAILGRETEAERLVSRFDSDLAALGGPPADARRAALYYANGYTAGDASLAGEILSAAGLTNIASELGLRNGGVLPLEQLVLADPDLLIEGRRYGGTSRAEDLLDHPALAALTGTSSALADSDWVCGTPHVIDAIRRLRDMAAYP